MRVLIVSKECAPSSERYQVVPQHVILSPEIPGRAKRSSARQLAVSPNSRSEPFWLVLRWFGIGLSVVRLLPPLAANFIEDLISVAGVEFLIESA
jgi:hypothetical protein